jgi:hypothetical protein
MHLRRTRVANIEPKTHYVAQLKVERVENKAFGTTEKREVSEVTMLTIKGSDLGDVKDRLGKHLELVEDD